MADQKTDSTVREQTLYSPARSLTILDLTRIDIWDSLVRDFVQTEKVKNQLSRNHRRPVRLKPSLLGDRPTCAVGC